MSAIPVIAFAAYSGTGKTTLIEQIIRCLKARGLRVGVIKHDAHEFEIDHEGKDSWRFAHAGADVTIVGSGTKTAIIEQRPHTVHELIARMEGVDLVIVEGYKNENLPKIGICRKATGKGFTAPLDTFVAVVTDDETVQTDLPRFALDDAQGVAAFIEGRLCPHRLGMREECACTR